MAKKAAAVIEKEEVQGARQGHRTIQPEECKLIKLKILNKDNSIEAKANCDGAIIPDKFSMESLDEELQGGLVSALQDMEKAAKKEIFCFKSDPQLTLVSIEFSARGTGENKEDVVIVKMKNPTGNAGNLVASGQVKPSTLSKTFREVSENLNDLMLPIYARERYPDADYPQGNLDLDGDDDDADFED